MAGFDNDNMYARGVRLEATTTADYAIMQNSPTDLSDVNITGSPEGVVPANPSSLAHDRSAGALWLKVTGTGNTGWEQISTSSTDLHTARFIVGNTSNGANYSTISSAIAAASSGDTVFIQTGVYTENLTMKAGVNLSGFGCDSLVNIGTELPNVIIQGKVTFNYTGNCTVSGIQFKTNGDYCLYFTSSNAMRATFVNCYIYAFNFNAINNDNSSSASRIYFMYCMGDIGALGITYYDNTGAGVFRFFYCHFQNNPVSTTASTGKVDINFTFFPINISTSEDLVVTSSLTGSLTISGNTTIITRSSVGNITGSGSSNIRLINSSSAVVSISNTSIFTCNDSSLSTLTLSDTSTSSVERTFINAGVPSAVTANAGTNVTLSNCVINSSNTNAITGAGTISYGGLTFTSSSGVNVTSQSILLEGPSRTVGGAKSGGTNQLAILNSSNTASSDALLLIQQGGGSGGDAYIKNEVSGLNVWTHGLDISDSSSYVFSATATLGTTNVARFSQLGSISFPLAGFTTDGVLYSLAGGVLASTSAGTAGQVLTSNGAGVAPTFQTSSSGGVSIVPVTIPGAYPYTTLSTDYVVIVDTSSARTINLIGSPATGRTYIIKDGTGTASPNTITITPASGTIDGASSAYIVSNYGSMTVIYSGSEWNIL